VNEGMSFQTVELMEEKADEKSIGIDSIRARFCSGTCVRPERKPFCDRAMEFAG
jgi:hypothetical protein